jgi:hypothetical protein
VLWAATDHLSVLAWAGDSAITEYPLGASCTLTLEIKHDDVIEPVGLDADMPIEQFVAPSPDDIWAVMRHANGIESLCRLRRRTQ